ncbi:MAG: hypothetical protein KF902_00460 [Phycisphaeraceae bacterium]|nr:hypothetical protein [Phycisphaeraceae bacterium]
MPKLRLIKDDPSLQDIIPFPTSLASGLEGPVGGRVGGRIGERIAPREWGRVVGRAAETSSRDLEHELLGTIDRMKEQLDELSGMLDPIPLFPQDDRPTAA